MCAKFCFSVSSRCDDIVAEVEPDKLPRRYMKALKSPADDSLIVVTQADKGGGVVLMDKSEYVKKLCVFLGDRKT